MDSNLSETDTVEGLSESQLVQQNRPSQAPQHCRACGCVSRQVHRAESTSIVAQNELRKQCIPVGDEGVLVASPREGFTYCDYIGYDTMNAPPLIPIPAKQCSPDASLGTAASNGNDDHGEQKTEDNLRKVLQENFAPGRPLTPFLNMLRCLPVDHHLGDSNSSSVSVAPSAQPQGQLPASSGRATASKRAKLGSVKLPYLNEGKSKLQNTQSTRRLVPSILHPYYRTTTSRNVETSAPTPVPGMSVAAARRRSLDPFLLPSTRVDQKGSSSRTESAKVSLPSLRSVVDSRIMEPLQEPSGMQDMLAAAPLSTSSAVWPEGSVIPHPAEGGAIPNPPSSQPMPMLANDSWAGGNGFLPADANLHGSAWPSFHWPSSSFDLHQTIDAMLPLSFETTTTSSIGSSTPSSILVSTPGAFTHLGNDSSKQVSAIDSYFPPMPIPSSLAFYEPLPASTYSPSVEYGASDSALAPPVSSFVAQQMSNTATAYHPGLPTTIGSAVHPAGTFSEFAAYVDAHPSGIAGRPADLPNYGGDSVRADESGMFHHHHFPVSTSYTPQAEAQYFPTAPSSGWDAHSTQ